MNNLENGMVIPPVPRAHDYLEVEPEPEVGDEPTVEQMEASINNLIEFARKEGFI